MGVGGGPALVEIVMVVVMILVHMHGHNLFVMHMMYGHLLVDGHMHLLVDGHMLDHRHRYLLHMMMMHGVHLVGHMDCVVLTGGEGEEWNGKLHESEIFWGREAPRLGVAYDWHSMFY